jgi:hypothetical protein
MYASQTPEPPPRNAPAAEFGYALLMFAAVSVFSYVTQKITLIRFWDSDEYYWMTYNMATRQPIRAAAPWVYRVAIPWIASIPSRWLLERGYSYTALAYPYYVINIAAAMASTLLLVVWLRRFVGSPAIRLVLVAAFLGEWHGPARFVYFYPIYVDPAFLLCLLGGLVLVEASLDRPSWRATAIVTTVCGLGTLCRESMILVAATFFIAHIRRPEGRRSLSSVAVLAAPLGTSVLAFAWAHSLVVSRIPYSAYDAALLVVQQKPVFTWVLAWFITFGPGVIAVACLDARGALAWLRERPHLAFFLAGSALLSFVGGTDTERILFWALPIVYVLAGRSLERNWPAIASAPILVVLAVAQVVSERLLWPVPAVLLNATPFNDIPSVFRRAYEALNRMIVVDTYYWNLWSFFGSRGWHAVLLAFDIVFVAAMALWVRRRAKALHPSAVLP